MSDDDIRALREALAGGPTPIAMELYGDRYFSGDYARADVSKAQHDYIAAASPDRIARLLDEVERLRADATRYRWLRGDSCMDHSARWTQWEVRRWDAPIWTNDLRRADLDAAIDDAMRKEPDHAR